MLLNSNKGRNTEMDYLPRFLKSELEYHLQQCPNLNIEGHPLINVDDILHAYYILADYFTDPSASQDVEKMLVGIRDYDLLTSAICRQTVEFCGKRKYLEPLQICATLFFGLVKDHAFQDGNKRTALLILLYQLQLYGYFPKKEFSKFEKLVVSVASNTLKSDYFNAWKKFQKSSDPEIKTIAYVLRRLVDRSNKTFHKNISMKEFCKILEDHGIICTLDNMKIKFTRETRHIIFPVTYKYTVNFYGWTRCIESKMARDVFDKLHLSGEYASFESFTSGRKSLYSIIEHFEIPLRRLKDE